MKNKYLVEVTEMVRQLADGEYNPEQFSFDFEAKLADDRVLPYWDYLEEMLEMCSMYEEEIDPSEEERLNVKYYDDEMLIAEGKKLYDKLIKL